MPTDIAIFIMIPRIFARYTMVIEDAILIVHIITFEHYPWLAMDEHVCQTLIFKLHCLNLTSSLHSGCIMYRSFSSKFFFSFRPTNDNSTQAKYHRLHSSYCH
jgi:hypothetical protein